MPHIATATLGVWVGAGSRHERQDEHGLSHLIEHMAFKGTRAPLRAPDRRGHRERRRRDQRRDLRRVHELHGPRARRDRRPSRSTSSPISSPSRPSTRRAEAREGRDPAGIAAVEDTPDDLVFDAFMETAFAGQADRPPDPRPARDHQVLRRGPIRAFMAREYTPAAWCSPPPATCDTTALVAAAERHFGALPEAPRAARAGLYTRRRAPHRAPARAGEPRARAARPAPSRTTSITRPTSSPCARRRADLAAVPRGPRAARPRLRDRRLPLALLRYRPVRHRRRHRRRGRRGARSR